MLRRLTRIFVHYAERYIPDPYIYALILTFVGVKMLGEEFFQIDIVLSLGIILGVLAAAIVASMMWPKRIETRQED